MPATKEELARLDERRRVIREESEAQYQLHLARFEAMEALEAVRIEALEFAVVAMCFLWTKD